MRDKASVSYNWKQDNLVADKLDQPRVCQQNGYEWHSSKMVTNDIRTQARTNLRRTLEL